MLIKGASMRTKYFYPWMLFACAFPCLGMNAKPQLQISDTAKAYFSQKHKITEQDFKWAMNTIKEKVGDCIAEKLSSRLEHFINKELSANEWIGEVKKAYIEICKGLGEHGSTIMSQHPTEHIVQYALFTIPCTFCHFLYSDLSKDGLFE